MTVVPAQPFRVGTILKVTVTGELVVFVNAPVMDPDPEAAIPVTETALSLVQLYTVPVKPPDGRMEDMVAPEQMV
jgi:hypothetical protein